jgi:ubiquitin-like protein Pup
MQRAHKERTKTKRRDPEPEAQETRKSSTLADDIDDLLEDIDEVLEQNAQEFVQSYVQKGGE